MYTVGDDRYLAGFSKGVTKPVPEDDEQTTGSSSEQPPASGQTEARFTQAELDVLAGKARESGRTAAEKRILADLGVETVDQAKAILAKQREAEEAQQSELEKAQAEIARVQAQAQKAQAEREEVLITSELKGSLRAAGIIPERLPAALTLVDRATLTIEGSEVKGLAEAVAALRAETPEWFSRLSNGAPDASKGGSTSTSVDYRTDRAAARAVLQEKYGLAL